MFQIIQTRFFRLFLSFVAAIWLCGFATKALAADNGRLTLSAAWDQVLRDRVRLYFGFDHRALTDDLNDKKTDSNLITAGAEVQVTDKLQFSVKREQNLGDA